MPDYMTAEQLSNWLQIPKQLAWKLGREGRIPGVVRVGPRLMRFERQALESYLANGGEVRKAGQPEPTTEPEPAADG